MADVELTVDMETAKAMRNALNLGKSIDKVGNKTKHLQSAFSKFSKIAAVGATAAVGAFAYAANKAIDSNDDFEKSLAKANTVLKIGNEGMNVWRKDISKWAGEIGASASEAAAALYDVASAQFTGQQATNVLKTAMKGAVAGFSSIKGVLPGIIAAMNNFGVTSEEALNNIFFATDKGIMEAEQYARSIADLGGVALNAKVGLADLASAMATMTKGKLGPEIAKTQLKGFLRAMTDPATLKKISKAMGKTFDFREMGMTESMKALRELQGILGAKDFSLLFSGDEAKQGVFGMLNSQKGTFEALRTMANDINGFSDAAFKNGASAAREHAKAQEQLSAVFRDFGKEMSGPYLEVVKSITQQIVLNKDSFVDVGKAAGEMLIQFGKLTPAISTLVSGISTITRGWERVFSGWAGMFSEEYRKNYVKDKRKRIAREINKESAADFQKYTERKAKMDEQVNLLNYKETYKQNLTSKKILRAMTA